MSRKTRMIIVVLLIVGVVQLSCNLGSAARQVDPNVPVITQIEVTAESLPSATIPPTDAPPSPTPMYATEVPAEAPAGEPTRLAIQLNPFEGWPEEYQAIQLPEELQKLLEAGQASVVPRPGERSRYEQLFYSSVTDPGLLGPFDFERMVQFEDEGNFAAVPARNIPETPDFDENGVMVGLVYDQDAFFGRDPNAVYEVHFYDGKAEIRSQATGQVVRVMERGKEYFWTDSKSNPEALVFFIKNGCWLCWNAGGRTGCLICF